MDKPHEEAAGYKHRSTDKFMNTFKETAVLVIATTILMISQQYFR
jgi:hypothetical protein